MNIHHVAGIIDGKIFGETVPCLSCFDLNCSSSEVVANKLNFNFGGI